MKPILRQWAVALPFVKRFAIIGFFGGAGLFSLAAVAQESNIDSTSASELKVVRTEAGTNMALPSGNDRPALLWWARLGEGYSGAFVAENRVFTQMQTRAGQYVVCLDLNSGRLLWQTRSNPPWQTGEDFPGPYATPVFKSGKVYYADCNGQTGCLDAGNGNILWTVNLTEKFKGQGTAFGYACSPLVDEERVILPVGGQGASVVACSARDGSVVWKTGDDAVSYSSSLLLQVQGHRQAVSVVQNALVAHDPLTGQELWRDHWSNPGFDMHNTAPLYQEPYLFCATSFKEGARVLKLGYEQGVARAELVWQSRALCNDIFSSVIVGNYIYGSDVEEIEAKPRGGTRSQFKCLELMTGKEVWSSTAPGHASVLSQGDKLFLVNESGMLIVIEASPSGYRELSRGEVIAGNKPCWTTPTLYQGRLLVRNQQTLVCYQIEDTSLQLSAGNQTNGLGHATLTRQGSPAGFTAKTNTRSWLNRVRVWLDRRNYSAYWMPSPLILARWFGCSVVLLALAAGMAWVMRKWVDSWLAFSVLSVVFGFIGLPVCSVLTNQLVFTWPVACHSFFVLLLVACDRPLALGKITPRVCLAGFVLMCVGYYFACRQFFLPASQGFLAGFLPALPATWWFVNKKKTGGGRLGSTLAFLLSFSLYFWGSALILLWRMGR